MMTLFMSLVILSLFVGNWFLFRTSEVFKNKKEIDDFDEMFKRIESIYGPRFDEINAKLEWKDFSPGEPSESDKPKKVNGKYNPDEIKGVFDGLFSAE